MEGRPRHRMSKKLQLAFSERRIRKGIYRMYARLRPYHLIGAIGGFLTVLTAIISLAVSTSYYISAEWVIIVNMLLIGSNGLIATYFFGAFSASRDSLIKVGSLIAGIGLGFNVLISILQMAGVYVFVLALLGALVMMAGVVIACIKFIMLFQRDIMLFQRDAFVVVFCVFIFLGLLLSLFWTWASLISGAGLGGLLIYFYVHNITY